MKLRHCLAAAVVVSLFFASRGAAALPGFLAGKGKPPTTLSTHVVVFKKGDATVVTVMPDYKGDLKSFALVMPVPSDVSLEDVKTLRRDFVEHLDQITAPRFHEFWEKHPCDPGKAEQIWEMDMRAKSDTAFLGGFQPQGDKPKRKVEKEMRLTVESSFKEGEHTFHLLGTPERAEGEGEDEGKGEAEGEGEEAPDIAAWLAEHGYKAPPGAVEAVKKYVAAGQNLLIAEVDSKRIELIGSDRAILSPIRYSTSKPVKLASTVGLSNLDGKQEIYIYTIVPKKRYETKNYPTMYPPTNIEVDFKVKERMGEFYAALHDLMLQKKPKAFVVEYAWPAKGCGEPCATEPLGIHEILTLGADVYEQTVPEEERLPEPPELSEEEEKQIDAIKEDEELDAKQKREEIKRFKEDRKELVRRKALVARHDDYVVTRLHHRYDKTTLPADIELGPGKHVEGGVKLPKGPNGELPTEVKPSSASKLQARYVFFHPSKAVLKCENPVRWRWGKPPRTYRGLRKIWVAQDLATRNRDSHPPAKLAKTPIPALGIAGEVAIKDGGADGGADGADKEGSSCGCESPARRPSSPTPALLLGATLLLTTRRRRRPRQAPAPAREL